jgi:DNA polymerase theta
MVIPDEVLPLQRLLLDSIITGLIDIQKGRSAVLDFLDSTLFYRQTADDRRDKWFQTIQACLLSLVGRQFLAPDDSASSQGYVIRPLGLATVKSSFPLEDALFLHSELARAMKTGLFLDGELHLCYLTTPLQAMIDPDWKLYARLLNRLPEEEQKIFERCGCDPTLVSSYAYRPPSHSSSSSAPPAAASALLRDQDRQLLCCRRFWNALILRDLINEVPVEEVCPKYNASMGAVEFLMSAAGSFTNQMVRFCERMEWWSLEACLKAYAQRFEFGSKMDVVELCGIRGIGSKRARILFRHGIRTVDAVARMSKEALTRKLGQMIDADMILASAVQICQSRARRAAFEARRLIESLTQSELRGVEDYDPVAMEHAEFVKTQLPSAAALPVVGKVPHP